MRLNINKYQEMMQRRNIEKADIERMTGITVQTLDWIFENEYLEVSTLERLAQVVECNAKEIALPDHYGNENVIKWVKDGKTATLSLTQGRTISRVMKLAKSRPEECKIVAKIQMVVSVQECRSVGLELIHRNSSQMSRKRNGVQA